MEKQNVNMIEVQDLHKYFGKNDMSWKGFRPKSHKARLSLSWDLQVEGKAPFFAA